MERGRVASTRMCRNRPTSGVTCRSRRLRGTACSRSIASCCSSLSRTLRVWSSIMAGIRRPGTPGPGAKAKYAVGGDGGIRTPDQGFADPCLNHLATSPRLLRQAQDRRWCRGGDLNPYALTGTAPSRRRVYLFHPLGSSPYITDFRLEAATPNARTEARQRLPAAGPSVPI